MNLIDPDSGEDDVFQDSGSFDHGEVSGGSNKTRTGRYTSELQSAWCKEFHFIQAKVPLNYS